MSKSKRASEQDGQRPISRVLEDQQAAVEKLAHRGNPAFYAARKRMKGARSAADRQQFQRAIDDSLFAALRAGSSRLDGPELVPLMVERCEIACKTNDVKFFVRLGRALSESGVSEPDRLADLVVAGWVGDNERPGFCWFSDDALAEFCRLALGNKALTLDAVRKTRQRLGLRKAGKPVITKVEMVNGEIMVS